MTPRRCRYLLLVIAFGSLSACSVKPVPLAAPITAVEVGEGQYQLLQSVTMEASHSAPTVLKAGTLWTRVGTIEHGNVFSTKDQVVIVNSFDVHEADIVAKDGSIVGYYLKVDGTFVETKPVPVQLEIREF